MSLLTPAFPKTSCFSFKNRILQCKTINSFVSSDRKIVNNDIGSCSKPYRKAKSLVKASNSVNTDTVYRLQHRLPSGLSLEVLELPNSNTSVQREPIVFIHGSYHAAWCWAEYFMPFFSIRGHDCYAISLLGQGGSDVVEGPYAGTIQTHAQDIAHFIAKNLSHPPILIGHSFGGLIVQAYLADVAEKWTGNSNDGLNPPLPRLAAAILACSVPPTGNMELVMRFTKTRPIASIKIFLSLAGKLFEKWTWLCRESFFSPKMSDEQVVKYQNLLKESSKQGLFDLRKLNSSLPVSKPPPNAPPIFVIGAQDDFIVDIQGVEETGEFLGVKPLILPNIAHDVMLDLTWESAATAIEEWLAKIRS